MTTRGRKPARASPTDDHFTDPRMCPSPNWMKNGNANQQETMPVLHGLLGHRLRLLGEGEGERRRALGADGRVSPASKPGDHHPSERQRAPAGVGLRGPEGVREGRPHHRHLQAGLAAAAALRLLLPKLPVREEPGDGPSAYRQLRLPLRHHRRPVSDAAGLPRVARGPGAVRKSRRGGEPDVAPRKEPGGGGTEREPAAVQLDGLHLQPVRKAQQCPPGGADSGDVQVAGRGQGGDLQHQQRPGARAPVARLRPGRLPGDRPLAHPQASDALRRLALLRERRRPALLWSADHAERVHLQVHGALALRPAQRPGRDRRALPPRRSAVSDERAPTTPSRHRRVPRRKPHLPQDVGGAQREVPSAPVGRRARIEYPAAHLQGGAEPRRLSPVQDDRSPEVGGADVCARSAAAIREELQSSAGSVPDRSRAHAPAGLADAGAAPRGHQTLGLPSKTHPQRRPSFKASGTASHVTWE